PITSIGDSGDLLSGMGALPHCRAVGRLQCRSDASRDQHPVGALCAMIAIEINAKISAIVRQVGNRLLFATYVAPTGAMPTGLVVSDCARRRSTAQTASSPGRGCSNGTRR